MSTSVTGLPHRTSSATITPVGGSHQVGLYGVSSRPSGWDWFVAVTTVATLLGSLFPAVDGLQPHVLATPFAALAIMATLIGPNGRGRRALLLLVPLFAILILAAAWGIEPQLEYGEVKFQRLWTSTLLSALLGCCILSKARMHALATCWVLAGLILATFTMLVGSSFSAGRTTAFGSNPIWLGRALASAIIFSVAMPRMGFNRRWLLAAPVLFVGLFMTGSRAPLIALAIGVLVLFLTSARRLIPALVLAAGAYAAVLTVPVLANSRLGELIRDDQDQADSSETRLEMWRKTYRLWEENAGGVGIGNWSRHVDIGAFEYPHNIFLEVGAELGTVAIIALVGSVAMSALLISRHSTVVIERRVMLALLLTETVAVSTSGDLSARTFFFLIFAALAMSSFDHRSRNDV